MSGAIYYPPADRTSQWYGPGNAIVAPNKLLWHTTEGAGGFPDYDGGGMAPNLTYDPWAHRWRQHFQLNGTSRAVKNGPGYSTNRQGTVQVEIACTNGWNAPAVAAGRAVWNLDDQAIRDLADFSRFMRDEWGVPLTTSVTFLPYPASGNSSKLSPAAFTAYRGHLAHMHVPFNDHSDTGALPIARILAAAGGTTTTPPPQEDDMFEGSDRSAIQNIQFTSNAAYANSGQALAELRAFVAYEMSDDKANFDRDAAIKAELDKIVSDDKARFDQLIAAAGQPADTKPSA